MTGAPIPAGADCVIPVEWTDGGVARVRIDQAPAPGSYIRRTGEDVTANETVLTKGTALGATQIGLLAAIGRARVMVRPRPRVVIFSTGNELVDVGVEPGPALERELIAFCREHLAHFKCPRSVDFVTELPRLPTGKLYKRLLRDRYWEGRSTAIV